MNKRRDNQRQNTSEARQDARAPYNFVPLPERAVDVREQPGITTLDDALPSHDVFRSDRRHGYFDVTLTTESPLYIRGMLTCEEAENKEAYRNKPDFFHTGNPNAPVIPGSSLRGMIRSLVEIVTWSKLQPISDRQLIYRAVGDTTSLGDMYREKFLGFNMPIRTRQFKFMYPLHTVKGGYLTQQNGRWCIRPATNIYGETFCLVDAGDFKSKPSQSVIDVWVQPPRSRNTYQSSSRPKLELELAEISSRDIRLEPTRGFTPAKLVRSGNAPKRHWYAAIYEADQNASLIEIPHELWTIYQDDLAISRGNNTKTRPLDNGEPLFYLVGDDGELVYFGSTMMFRLPYQRRAINLIYDEETHPKLDAIDFAEALFGYVRGAETTKTLDSQQIKQGDPRRAYASRVSVSNAKMVTQTDDPYDIDAGGITPKVLGSPKPTTFQHYLEQPNGKFTPKQDLHHYGTNGAKIRGHKLYWRQRVDTVPTDPDASPDSKQHTRMRPIKRGIQFRFRVDFENLTEIELGALAWVLTLGSANHHPDARHMLGMGKPFGMGVVKLDAALVLRDRQQRYTSLFSDTGWSSGDALANANDFIHQFVAFISAKVGESYSSRMKELLTMLEGRSPNPLFAYMQLEPKNEYKDRPVLPYPTEINPSPEILAHQELERLRQEEQQREIEEKQRQQQELERRKQQELQQKKERGVQKNDTVQGNIKGEDEDGNIIFDLKPPFGDGTYTGRIIAGYRKGLTFKPNDGIWAFVLEIEEYEDDKGRVTKYLWCRRATKEDRQK